VGSNASSSLLSALVLADPHLSGWQAAIYNSHWNLANLLPFAVVAVLVIVFTRGQLAYRPDSAPQLGAAPGQTES
jgi:hypothetical protein